jgi:uncharacterized protein YggE
MSHTHLPAMPGRRSLLRAAPAAAMLGALALSSLAVSAPARAQEPVAPKIVVTGVGEVAVAPDMATVSLTILRQGETAREAMDAANEATRDVFSALKEEGIADRDLQTTGLSVQPDYAYPQPSDPAAPPRITSYRVLNTITARLRDLTKVGDVIDRAVTLGVNQGGDIVFGNADPKPVLEEARKLAVQDARARAEVLAAAAGARLGGLVEIVEGAGGEPPRPMDAKILRMEAADSVPVQAGENTYRIQVQVTWGIAP